MYLGHPARNSPWHSMHDFVASSFIRNRSFHVCVDGVNRLFLRMTLRSIISQKCTRNQNSRDCYHPKNGFVSK